MTPVPEGLGTSIHLGEELGCVWGALGFGHGGVEALMNPQQSFELVDGVGVVIDAQVHLQVVAAVEPGAVPDDEECR